MSRLFLATEASLHRQVVIKLLPPEFASEVSATRFRQEIEVAAHLQHTNILPVLTAGAKDDLLFYVMPFVPGESLRHRLTREGKLPVTDAARILHEIADALAHAHAEGVIHRDIKPENILLLGSHAVLTDFGVARALAESRSGGRLTDPGLAVAAAAVAILLRSKAPSSLDPDLVAIAPFDVLAPTLELWHEGLVDVLSRNLDGAGPLRTVSPTVVVRRWSGRADPTSAKELGRKTGAQVVVFGGIVAAGQDSVRLPSTVFDVGSGTALAELELHGTAARMDRLSDSLTVGVLRELGRTRPIGAVRLASLGSTSLPAIKAFLRGEQFYRRAVWDSALVYARRAVAIDSNFTLALRRIPLVLWWSISDTSWTTYELRAGALNHGLAPRESLLVAADSLWGALDQGEASEWPLMRHLVRTLEEALRRYPDDPEVWYLWAEMAYQHYSPLQIPVQKNLEAYQRAIELDSAFGPAYEHAVDLAIRMDRLDWARRYAGAERALAPAPYVATSLSLIDKLLSPRGAQSPEVARMLDTLSGDSRWETPVTIRRWPDSAETVLRLARL